MTTPHFCAECNNMLYPKEDRINKQLLYSCRICDFSAFADEACVFRNELRQNEGETAGVTTDVGMDPTLPRTNRECPRCHETDSVFFQTQGLSKDSKMTLFFVCTHCSFVSVDTM